MTPEHFAQLCDVFERMLRQDPLFAKYLDARDVYERRRLGLPTTEYKRKETEE